MMVLPFYHRSAVLGLSTTYYGLIAAERRQNGRNNVIKEKKAAELRQILHEFVWFWLVQVRLMDSCGAATER
jgi:hypothetical protein